MNPSLGNIQTIGLQLFSSYNIRYGTCYSLKHKQIEVFPFIL